MRIMILTSAGFNNKNIKKIFLNMVNIKPQDIKALFIPTAAVHEDAKAMLPVCRKDLTDAGIIEENIFTYNLDTLIDFDFAKQFSVIYFCGGNPEYLLSRINEVGFNLLLEKLLDNGMVYIGVSAGSIVATNNIPNNLGYVDCYLSVHCDIGSPIGAIEDGAKINLTDNQAILVVDDKIRIVE